MEMANMTDSLEQWGRLYDNGKVADAMVKANPELLKGMGYASPEQFHTQSAQDKIAATTGYFKNQGAAELAARLKGYDAQTHEREQQEADDQTAGAFLQNYLTAGTGTNAADGGDELSVDERMRLAAQKTPNMSGRLLPKIMDSLTKYQAMQQKAVSSDTPIVTQDLGGGRKGYRMPGSKQFEVKDDAGEMLMDTKPKTEDIPPGHMALQVGKSWKVVQDPTQWETTTTTDPANPFAITKTQRYIGKGSPAAANAPAALPTVTTKAQFDALKSGDKYLGKDGSTYTKP